MENFNTLCITGTEKNEYKFVKLIKTITTTTTTIMWFFLVLIVIIVAAGWFYCHKLQELEMNLNAKNAQIANLEEQIANLEEQIRRLYLDATTPHRRNCDKTCHLRNNTSCMTHCKRCTGTPTCKHIYDRTENTHCTGCTCSQHCNVCTNYSCTVVRKNGFSYEHCSGCVTKNCDPPCFLGETCVRILGAAGTEEIRRIADLRRGDRICTGGSKYVALRMLLKCEVSTAHITTLPNGVQITPTHPAHHGSKWEYPRDIAGSTTNEIKVDAVYNLLLEPTTTPWVEIEGVRFITLAHNITDDSLLFHEFLGTDAIIEDCKKLDGWDKGYVVISLSQIRRDPATGYICGISE
jgi:hypothetical protein